MITPIEQVIDIRELRIGNYLEYEGKIVHVTMLSLDIDDEHQEQICFCELGKYTDEKGDWNRALCDKLRRIPIIPELVKKLGGANPYSSDKEIWQLGSFTFKLHHEYGLCQYDAEQEAIIYGTIHYKWLHQLQNLIFALTGMELKMNS